MNPVAVAPVEELQRVTRNVLCTDYECCLEVALFRGWKNFSCKSCASFHPAQRTALEWHEDGLCCADLLSIVFGFWIMPETDL